MINAHDECEHARTCYLTILIKRTTPQIRHGWSRARGIITIITTVRQVHKLMQLNILIKYSRRMDFRHYTYSCGEFSVYVCETLFCRWRILYEHLCSLRIVLFLNKNIKYSLLKIHNVKLYSIWIIFNHFCRSPLLQLNMLI